MGTSWADLNTFIHGYLMLITLSNNKQGNAITINRSDHVMVRFVKCVRLVSARGEWGLDTDQRWPAADQWEGSWDWSVMSWPITALAAGQCPVSRTDTDQSWPIETHACPGFLTSSECGVFFKHSWGTRIRLTRVYECCPIFCNFGDMFPLASLFPCL